VSKTSEQDECVHDDGDEPCEYLFHVPFVPVRLPGKPREDMRSWGGGGRLAVSVEGNVHLTVGVQPFWRHCLTALAATGITYYVLSFLVSENPMGYTVIALFVWIGALTPVFGQVMHIEIDPSILHALFLCKEKIIALELSSGRWIVISSWSDHEELLATLRALYGENMRDI